MWLCQTSIDSLIPSSKGEITTVWCYWQVPRTGIAASSSSGTANGVCSRHSKVGNCFMGKFLVWAGPGMGRSWDRLISLRSQGTTNYFNYVVSLDELKDLSKGFVPKNTLNGLYLPSTHGLSLQQAADRDEIDALLPNQCTVLNLYARF